MACISELLQRRQILTDELIRNPYSIKAHLDRSKCYESLNYPDLAVGDAYKALLLIDELLDEEFEYHEDVLEALENEHAHSLPNDVAIEAELQKLRLHSSHIRFETIQYKFNTYAPDVYRVLARNLAGCRCLKSAYDYCLQGLDKYHDDEELEATRARIFEDYKTTTEPNNKTWDETQFDWRNLPDQGSVRRVLYPWNQHEPDRYSEAILSSLSLEMAKIAPKCSVEAVNLSVLTENERPGVPKSVTKQLGIFAKENIEPGELILTETSVLTANNRLLDPLCDACSRELPPLSETLYRCDECEDIVFCSAECKQLALSKYHPAICGKELEAVGKDPDGKNAAASLYFLLLGRAFALAETQSRHPLDLDEVKFLWGDFVQQVNPETGTEDPMSQKMSSSEGGLPFSFQYNVLAPLNFLEKMDIDIFAGVDKYDTWIFNVLYAKFRGVASGRMNHRTGKPEVCAVHSMWCLANHSCAPNVRWEWGGEIKFWARDEEEMVKWEDTDGKGAGPGRRKAGIEQGEEILNHYCDIELDVQARREWAAGALGGLCQCERCRWELRERQE